jgi:hypothetical protein
MKSISTMAYLLLAVPSFAAEPTYSALAEYGDWSVFTDGDVCWIETLSAWRSSEDSALRLTVTFYDDVYDGALAVFNPRGFSEARLFALVVEGGAFPLDRGAVYPDYLFNNTSGLMSALRVTEVEMVELKVVEQVSTVTGYEFSLNGYMTATKTAREECEGSI